MIDFSTPLALKPLSDQPWQGIQIQESQEVDGLEPPIDGGGPTDSSANRQVRSEEFGDFG